MSGELKAAGFSLRSRHTSGKVTPPKHVYPNVELPCTVGAHTARLKGEDAYCVQELEVAGYRLLMLGVYDGHSGRDASQWCASNLVDAIAEAIFEQDNEDSQASTAHAMGGLSFGPLGIVARVLQDVFQRMHDEIREAHKKAGTTATLLVIDTTHWQALVANVGDSDAVVVDAESWAVASTSHRLDDSKYEVDRVRRAGATVARAVRPDNLTPSGGLRLWPGGLALGRSLGDADCGTAVIPDPDVEIIDIKDEVSFVVCSDGVWDALRCADVAKIARVHDPPDAIARCIVRTAVDKAGLRDDITCVVITLGRDTCQSQSSQSYSPDASPEALRQGSSPPGSSPKKSSVTSAMGKVSALFGRLGAHSRSTSSELSTTPTATRPNHGDERRLESILKSPPQRQYHQQYTA